MKPIAPEPKRALARLVGGYHADRHVARGEVGLQALEHAPALHVGQEDVERHHRRLVLAHHGERARAGAAHHALEALLPRRVEQDAREAEVVLDDQEDLVAGLDVVAVVVGLVGELHRRAFALGRQRLDRVLLDLLPGRSVPGALRPRRRVARRQVQGEGAARPGRADELDLAAEELRELAADREAQARAAVLAAGRAVGLLERLEDDLLLVRRDADAGVAHREGDHPLGALELLVLRRPARRRRRDGDGDVAGVGELERVGEQVLDDLLQPLDVGDHRLGQARVDVDVEVDLLRVGDVAEGALDVALQVVEAQLREVHVRRAGLDLGEVEDVGDEREQVVARGMDGLRELDLLRVEVALGVARELVGEDEQVVERRPQLVRHVGEELGLVLRGEGELRRLLLERLARLLDLAVLALHLLVLVRQQPRLVLQLLVGLPQLLGERLRLLEQVLGAGVGLDGVDHDADRLGELVEEGLVRRVEALERGELDHAAHLALEDHRQHQHVGRRLLREAGGDAEARRRHVREQDLALLERALADQAFAQPDFLAVRAPGRPRRSSPAARAWTCRSACRARRTRPAARRPPARARTGSSGRPRRGRAGPAACGRTWRGWSSASPARCSSASCP